jgi:hypothetical protein
VVTRSLQLAHRAAGLLFACAPAELFINYKLKSVAHLPWRAFMYNLLRVIIITNRTLD